MRKNKVINSSGVHEISHRFGGLSRGTQINLIYHNIIFFKNIILIFPRTKSCLYHSHMMHLNC